jgi:hypothetical protein
MTATNPLLVLMGIFIVGAVEVHRALAFAIEAGDSFGRFFWPYVPTDPSVIPK